MTAQKRHNLKHVRRSGRNIDNTLRRLKAAILSDIEIFQQLDLYHEIAMGRRRREMSVEVSYLT
jgi:hypothetical protein